jgi:integrase
MAKPSALTDDGVALFEDQTAGKLEDERVFSRSDGSPWYRMAVVRAMRAACEGGKIIPPATFHTIRHTYASHLRDRNDDKASQDGPRKR